MGKSMVRRGRRRGVRPSARLVGRIRGGVVLTARAKARLDLVDWHHAHGGNVSRTARHFGYSRPTVYRWLGRYDRGRLETLEDRPSRPLRRRRPTWTLSELVAVRDLRERYPRWGQGQARRAPAAGGDPPVMLDGGTDPRAPAAERRVARAGRAQDQRAAAGLASATRSAPPSRPSDRRPGRSRRARHARRPATRDDPSALSSSGRAIGPAAGTWSSCAATPWPARRPRSSTRSPRGCPSRSAPSASTTARSSWPSSRRPAWSEASACTSCRPAHPS